MEKNNFLPFLLDFWRFTHVLWALFILIVKPNQISTAFANKSCDKFLNCGILLWSYKQVRQKMSRKIVIKNIFA